MCLRRLSCSAWWMACSPRPDPSTQRRQWCQWRLACLPQNGRPLAMTSIRRWSSVGVTMLRSRSNWFSFTRADSGHARGSVNMLICVTIHVKQFALAETCVHVEGQVQTDQEQRAELLGRKCGLLTCGQTAVGCAKYKDLVAMPVVCGQRWQVQLVAKKESRATVA